MIASLICITALIIKDKIAPVDGLVFASLLGLIEIAMWLVVFSVFIK